MTGAMTGGIGVGGSTYGTLDRVLDGVGSLRQQFDMLQRQTTTGKLADSYGGLGNTATQVLDLAATASRTEAYTQTIAQAQGRASTMQDALTQINGVVTGMAARTLGAIGSTPGVTVEAAAQQARLALSQIGALLNTSYGGDYVFAGADTANPPVPDADNILSSGMVTRIGTAMAALATMPTNPALGTVIADTVAIASDTTPGTTVFSSYLTGAGATAAPTGVQIGEHQRISLDLPANRNVGSAPDPAINGTGSSIGDILRSLAVVANATPAMQANPDFAAMMKDAAKTLSSAGTTLSAEAGRIGLAQTAMTAATASHASLKTILARQLDGLTNVDMAAAISRLQAVNTQLQASYNVLSMARGMNLASYL